MDFFSLLLIFRDWLKSVPASTWFQYWCNIPNTSWIDEITFVTHGFADEGAVSAIQLDWYKLALLYRYLDVTVTLDLINLNKFKYEKVTEKEATILEF